MDQGFTIWLTGLSGAGKSTLARGLEVALRDRGRRVEVLDGDEVREHLSKGLGFSKADRDTNIRRIAYVARLLTRNGTVAIVAAISPYREVRDEARRQIGAFVEVHVACPLDELVRRDVKGLYARALRGDLPQFTGVSDPYEAPLAPEVVVRTDQERPEQSLARILAYLEGAGYLVPGDGQVPPHGGRLVNRLATPHQAAALGERLPTLPRLRLERRALADVELIAVGAFSPLEGFLGRRDYDSVLERMRLASGLPWAIPITLAVSEAEAEPLEEGQEVALLDEAGRAVAVLQLQERYRREREREALAVYRTTDPAHPGVAALQRQGEVLLAGPVTLLRAPGFESRVPRGTGSEPGTRNPDLRAYALDPAETRREFARRGWRTVVGFQTRNPVHRAHEYLQKCALEIVDGLLLHPLVGETKDDDVPAEVRLRCYRALLERYFPRERVLLAVLPATMHYAGPREAVHHALVRKNYGCSHFIVGRDHAGVGSYYGSYDAHHIFRAFAPHELGITPLFFDHAFYCRACEGMATARTCPHDGQARVVLSGTRVRELLHAGELPPPEYTRPEVASILAEAVNGKVAGSESRIPGFEFGVASPPSARTALPEARSSERGTRT